MATDQHLSDLSEQVEDAIASLSRQARSIWGKSDYGEGEEWLPLYLHAADTAVVANHLWNEWLPEATRRALARGLHASNEQAKSVFLFLAAVHDVGKATPVFQGKWPADLVWKPERAGLPVKRNLGNSPTHPIAGELILSRYLQDIGSSHVDDLATIVGAHHGRFPSRSRVGKAMRDEPVQMGWAGEGQVLWEDVQKELVHFALDISGLDELQLRIIVDGPIPVATQSLLCGALIMADWMASDQDAFPLVPLLGSDETSSGTWLCQRWQDGWSHLSVTPAWHEQSPEIVPFDEFFPSRFSLPVGARPRPVQEKVAVIANETPDPGLIIVEAPMGEGKTEAALAAAEILASRLGMGGVCVALPTMATTDAMFARVAEWLERLPHEGDLPEKSIWLAHGKAHLNERFSGLVNASRRTRYDVCDESDPSSGWSKPDDVIVSEWMRGRKRGMLANFVVCTVDQVLMAALNMKHLPLRQLACVNKVVVIDECHAYDLYMRQYLDRLLQWLGWWHVPVVLLSATLPPSQRREMADAYVVGRRLSGARCPTSDVTPPSTTRPLNVFQRLRPAQGAQSPKMRMADELELDAYPLITYTDGSDVRRSVAPPSGREVPVHVELIDDDLTTLAKLLGEKLSDGGCAGVICDTVTRAQSVADLLREEFSEDVVNLDHSRFLDIDRLKNESELRRMLGRDATRENGRRPSLSIVVGTQVLEQSLDIDFDLLVTDVAPIDLLLQRMGRMHRHPRGSDEDGRPPALRHAWCYVRGVAGIEDGGPVFARGITSVYDRASLMVTMALLQGGAVSAPERISLPRDIPRLVRLAYGSTNADLIPRAWSVEYAKAQETKKRNDRAKMRRAQTCLLQSLSYLADTVGDGVSLLDLIATNEIPDDAHDTERGQQAVRDTQETLEVLLVEELADEGGIALLPWVGRRLGVDSLLPVWEEPDPKTSRILAQCAVRLPLSVCPLARLDACIDELEGRCWRYVGAWQDSPWLAGRLILPMRRVCEDVFQTELFGKTLQYSRCRGLSTIDESYP